LSALAACGYAARIFSFRLTRRRAAGHLVCDRYFYDNLVHYAARTRRERCYIRLLLLLIPRPDLAVLLLASPDTIAQRRPEYASEYVTSVIRGYITLSAQCPDIVTLSTDTSEPALPHILDLVRRRVLRRVGDERGGPSTRRRSNSRSLSW
jgi:thymidylate kinase